MKKTNKVIVGDERINFGCYRKKSSRRFNAKAAFK